MIVAIASQDLARVDAHFGWARHLMLYEVTAEGYRHLRTVSFRAGTTRDGNPGKLLARAKPLKGCSVVFVADIGPEGEHALARQRVMPIRRYAGQPVSAALDALSEGMRTGKIPLLRHDVRRRPMQRRRFH